MTCRYPYYIAHVLTPSGVWWRCLTLPLSLLHGSKRHWLPWTTTPWPLPAASMQASTFLQITRRSLQAALYDEWAFAVMDGVSAEISSNVIIPLLGMREFDAAYKKIRPPCRLCPCEELQGGR
eukprot:g2481.t1